MGDLDHLDFTPRTSILETLAATWRKPIEPMLEQIRRTSEKPVAELTMPEILAWVTVLAYAFGTGIILGQLAGNVALTVLRGPR